MTPEDFEPGCFGSAIFHRVDAKECVTCSIGSECELKTRERETVALDIVQRFDVRFNSAVAQSVIKWMQERWKEKTASKTDTTRFKDIFTNWTSRDINPYLLSHNKNPVAKDVDAVLHECFAFIISAKAFKVRDIQEHIIDIFPQINKSKATQYAKLLCDTLIYLKIINKGSKGLLSI